MRRIDRKIQPLSPPELDQRAEIHDEDRERARATWRRHAPPRYRDLLDAREDEE